MTDIEKKALALLNECGWRGAYIKRKWDQRYEALCRAIERHEAFRQEVSDAVRVLDEFITGSEDYKRGSRTDGVHLADGRSVKFARFIIAKPVDPLVEALEDLDDAKAREAKLRACLGFFASVIKSGEPWTATCEERYRAALQEQQT